MAGWWMAVSRGSHGTVGAGAGGHPPRASGTSRGRADGDEGGGADGDISTMSSDEFRSRCAGGEKLLVVCGHVFDVSALADVHPGGRRVLETGVGRDVTPVFFGQGDGGARRLHAHSRRDFDRLFSRYIVARLAPGGRPGDLSRRGDVYAYWKRRAAPAGAVGADGRASRCTPTTTTGTADVDTCVDMSRPIVGQIASLRGSLYERWIHCRPCTSAASPRFFEWELLEACSKSHWAMVPAIWGPVALWALLRSLRGGNNAGGAPDALAAAAWCALGFLLWFVLEYTIHRFLFHLSPTSRFGKTLHFIVHGCHHKFPMDKMRLVFPPAAAAPLAALLHLGLHSALPCAAASATFAGSVAGYVVYDVTHYALHSSYAESWTTCQLLPWLGRLRVQHFHHHFVDDSRNFGITSGLLDLALGTASPDETDRRL